MKVKSIANVEVLRRALAAAPGTLRLSHTSKHCATATLALFWGRLTQSIQLPVLVGDGELERVAPKEIKIDFEAFERQVLWGLCRTCAKDKPFPVTELVDDPLARAGTRTDEIDDDLQEFGDSPAGIDTERSPIRHGVVLRQRAAPSPEFFDRLWQ